MQIHDFMNACRNDQEQQVCSGEYEDASILNPDAVLNMLGYDVLRRFPSNPEVMRASE